MSPVPDPLTVLLDRLASIEAKLDRLAAAPAPSPAKGTRAKRERAPGKYLTTAEALDILRCERTTLDGHVARGLCRPLYPKGKGRGKPVRYVREEIEVLAVSEDAAREHMARKKRSR